MSAISELGIGSNDILPYLNPVAPEIEAPSVNISAPTQSVPVMNVAELPTVPTEIRVQPLPTSQPVDTPEPVDISGIERTVEAILASFANITFPVGANVEQPNIGSRIEDRILTPTVNAAPVVAPADVSVQPLLQSSPVVNVPPANLPELSVQSAPVNVQPPNVFTAPLELLEFGSMFSGLIDNLNNKDTSIKLVAPQSQAPSTPLLIQHSQNQAVMNGQAQVQAQEQSPDRPVSVNNHVDVTIEGKPVELYIDGEKVGSAVLRWTERQSTRSGVSPF